MKNSLLISIALILSLSLNILAATPTAVNYQGLLTDGSGTPVADGSYAVTFNIWNQSTGGTSLWNEAQLVNTVNGLFSVLLGTVNPLVDSVFSGSATYLGIQVGIDSEMTPRTALVSVPYAYRVSTINGAGGGNITSKVSIGAGHTLTGNKATITGGVNNTANGELSTVSGGEDNTASEFRSVVSGGFNNTASGEHSTVGGGVFNIASGEGSTIGGGQSNTNSGLFSTIPGGWNNQVTGDVSFAAGSAARAIHDGTFVWNNVNGIPFASTADKQFLIRSAGGVGINTNSPQAVNTTSALTVNGSSEFYPGDGSQSNGRIGIGTPVGVPGMVGIALNGNRRDIRFTNGGIRLASSNTSGGANHFVGITINESNNVGINTELPNYMLDVRGSIGNTSTLYHSDRRWKDNISTLSNSLNKVQKLRGVSFDWKRDEFEEMNFPEGKQIGLIAQEVEEVLPEVVNTAKDGYKSVEYSKLIALLIEANKEQQKDITSLKLEVDELRSMVTKLTELSSKTDKVLSKK